MKRPTCPVTTTEQPVAAGKSRTTVVSDQTANSHSLSVRQRAKRSLFRPLAAIAVSMAALAWVLSQVELVSVLELLSGAKLSWLVMAYGLFLAAAFIHTWRFSLLLSAVAKPPRYQALLRTHFIGMTCNNILPGELGLDAVRIHVAGGLIGGQTKVIGAVLFDRLSGAIAVAALSTLACCVLISRYGMAYWFLVPSVAVMVVGLLLGVFVSLASKQAARFVATRGWIPEFVRRTCDTLATTMAITGTSRRLFCAIVLAASQCALLAISLAMMSRALSLPASDLAVAAIFPIISIITLTVPISVNGLGVREAMFCLTGAAVGLDENQALALASTWLVIMLLGCVPGVVGILSVIGLRGNLDGLKHGVDCTDSTECA